MSGEYIKIEQEKYDKLKFQARSQYAAILSVFRCYGLDPFVDQAIGECMKVTENFGMIVRGEDKPIHILSEPKRRGV